MATIAEKNIILRLQTDTRKAQQDINKVSKSVTGLTGIARNAASTFAGLFAFEGAQAVGQQLSALSRQSVNLAISAEQTKVAFETFLGSASKATEVLAELDQFSTLTPFEPEQVIRAGQSLLAFGIEADKLTDTLTKVGNVAAGTGTDFNELAEIFGKAKTQGRLFGEDINQLTGRGIPIIAEFAKQFGVAESEVKGLVTAGRIGFPELEKAFGALTSEGGKFFNLIEKQSQTVGGRISTLTGNFNALLKAIGERLLPAVGSLVDFFNGLALSAKEFVEIKPSEELAQEAIEMQKLNLELNDANTSEARRNEIIGEINKKYPKLLQNLKDEETDLDAVTAALNKANKAFVARIALQQQEEQLEEQRGQAGRALTRLIRNEDLLREAVVKAANALDLQSVAGDNLAEQTNFLKTALSGNIALLRATTDEADRIPILAQAIDRLRFAESQLQTSNIQLEGSQGRVAESTEFLGRLREKLADDLKLFDQIIRDTTKSEDENTDGLKKNTAATNANADAKKKQLKAEQDLKKEREKREASDLALFAAFEEKKAFDELLESIEKEIAARAKLESARKSAADEAERLRQSALDDEKQFNLDRQRLADESIQTTFEAEEIDIETQRLNRIKNGEDTLDLDIKILQARLKTAKIGSLEFIKIQQELAEKIREAEEKEFDERVSRQERLLDSIRQAAIIAVDIRKESLAAQTEILDIQIDEQEKRVKTAVELAKNGNAELLQAEEDRLSALREERAQNANQLQQIAAVEVAANQAIAISQGIVAVTAAFQRNFVEGIAASVALAATVASTVAAVQSSFGTIQTFAEGTRYVEGPGTSKSDSIPARLSVGEGVMPADVNAKFDPLLNEVFNDTPKAQMMQSMLLNGNIPTVQRERVAGASMNTRGLEKQLQMLNERFDALQMSVTLDSDGFSASLEKYRANKERSKKLIR